MKQKAQRLAEIRRIVQGQEVSTHQQLVEELKTRGFEVTQATVSRDLTELGLPKIRKAGKSVYSLPEVEKVRKMMNDFVQDIETSQNLVVVKSLPGSAQSVASSLDGTHWPDLLGTVAGDDTVLLITRDTASGQQIAEQLTKLKDEAVG